MPTVLKPAKKTLRSFITDEEMAILLPPLIHVADRDLIHMLRRQSVVEVRNSWTTPHELMGTFTSVTFAWKKVRMLYTLISLPEEVEWDQRCITFRRLKTLPPVEPAS
jgi:hypothetical protein